MTSSVAEPALFVDLDGTLIHTDLLWESLASAARLSPMRALRGLSEMVNGRAAIKRALARASLVDAGNLPYRGPFLEWLQSEAARGRRIYLATAADQHLADRVSRYLGLFTGVIASDGQHNRKGQLKLQAIRDLIGDEPFDYCGNDTDDLPLFAAARQAIVVGAPPYVLRQAQSLGNVQRVFPDRQRAASAWWRALRPALWLKGLLLLVPLLTLMRMFDAPSVRASLIALVAFSMAASAGYLFNDVLDLQSDRRHTRRKMRMLAAGVIAIKDALGVAILLVAASLALAWWFDHTPGMAGGGAANVAGQVVGTGTSLFNWLLIYLALSTLYSVIAKRLVIVDTVGLALMDCTRVLAGAAALGVVPSFWLMAFCGFLFLSLAMLKRCAELQILRDKHEETARGLAYRVADLAVLLPLGLATGVAALVILALYSHDQALTQRYLAPQWLGLSLAAMLVWLGRLWLIANRGLLHDDPWVFTLSDRTGQLLVGLMAAGYVLALLA